MLFLENSYKCQNIGNVFFFSSFPLDYLLFEWKSQLPIFQHSLFSLRLPLKISVPRCCTCCLSFLETQEQEGFFIYFSVTPVSRERWFLLTPSSCSPVCPRGIIWSILPCSSALGHRQRQFFCVTCGMFHGGRARHIKCCNSWNNTSTHHDPLVRRTSSKFSFINLLRDISVSYWNVCTLVSVLDCADIFFLFSLLKKYPLVLQISRKLKHNSCPCLLVVTFVFIGHLFKIIIGSLKYQNSETYGPF